MFNLSNPGTSHSKILLSPLLNTETKSDVRNAVYVKGYMIRLL